MDVLSYKKETFILGDFNSQAVDWQSCSFFTVGTFSDHLLEFTETGHLSKIIIPTFFRVGIPLSILDLTFFSAPVTFSNFSRLSLISLNDNVVVRFLLEWLAST